MKLKTLFTFFIFLNILDVVTTIYGITFSGLYEQNRFILPIIDFIGLIPALIIGKIICLITIWFLINQGFYLKNSKPALIIVNIFYITVVINNFLLIYSK